MKRRNMTAMAMAAMMIMANVSPSVMAYAGITVNKNTDNVKDGGTTDSINASNGGSVTADSVTEKVTADGEGTTVTVTGNAAEIAATDKATVNAGSVTGKVTAGGDGTTVTVTGSAGSVEATNKANVTAGEVKGLVKADGDGTEVTVTGKAGSVQATGSATVNAGTAAVVNAKSGSDVTADSVTEKVTADGEGTTVTVIDTVGGKVTATDSAEVTADSVAGGVSANNATVTVDDTVSGVVDAKSGSDVTAGKVIGTISADNSTVTVTGNVEDEDSAEETYTVDAKNGAKITIDGNLVSEGGKAIELTGDNVAVIVKGDVEADTDENISIDASAAGTGNEVAIGGTLKNGDKDATLAVATTKDDDDVDVVDESKMPEIVVGTIEDISNLKVTDSKGEGLSAEETKKVIDNIKYIIDDKDLQNGVLTITKLDGNKADEDSTGTYYVAKAAESFKVKVNVPEGYELSGFDAGTGVVYEKKGSGTYIVEMPAGGGISLNAVLKLIEKAEEAKKTEATTTTTVTRTSSGGGSGSSSSGSHAIAVTSGVSSTSLPTTPGGWKKNADSTWNYVNADGGIYKSTWIVSNNRWYYADANGRIATGWMEINGVWYYFSVADTSTNPEGSMLAGTTTPDGYKLASNGAWVK